MSGTGSAAVDGKFVAGDAEDSVVCGAAGVASGSRNDSAAKGVADGESVVISADGGGVADGGVAGDDEAARGGVKAVARRGKRQQARGAAELQLSRNLKEIVPLLRRRSSAGATEGNRTVWCSRGSARAWCCTATRQAS